MPVWRWAGKYRTSARNLGVDYWTIEMALRQRLMTRAIGWSTKPIRLTRSPCASTTLVAIHPFPNGNGRWSRLAADLLALQLGQERFTRGAGFDRGGVNRPGDLGGIRVLFTPP